MKKSETTKNYTYTAKLDLPFGVTKGQIFIKKGDVFINKNNDVQIPYKCDKELTFFKKEEIIPDLFAVDTQLLLTINLGKVRNIGGTYFNLTKNNIFTYVKQDASSVYVKHTNGVVFPIKKAMFEKSFIEVVKYFYVGDDGIIKTAFYDVNKNADNYRKKMKNVFTNWDDASIYQITYPS